MLHLPNKVAPGQLTDTFFWACHGSYTSFSLPEYTSYDSMLSVFRRLVPIPSLLAAQDNYRLNLDQLREAIKNQGISVVVGSNPRNPTGSVIKNEDMKELVKLARDGPTTIVSTEAHISSFWILKFLSGTRRVLQLVSI